jgi:hypothetical protein
MFNTDYALFVPVASDRSTTPLPSASPHQSHSATFAKHFPLCALSLYRTPATATTAAAIDLFAFYHLSGVLICKPCGYTVLPTTLSNYIKVYYPYDAPCAATNSSASSQPQNISVSNTSSLILLVQK